MDERREVRTIRALQDAGYRLTKPRLAVAHVLADNSEGLSPEEIYEQGRVLCPSLGLVTVYRTLELLDDLGVVRRVHDGDRCQKYASANREKHYLVCQRCHRVMEFPCHGLDGLISDVREGTGFVITGHLLELQGICPQCQQQRAEGVCDEDEGNEA